MLRRLILISIACIIAGLLWLGVTNKTEPAGWALSTLKVMTADGGHGSGVHIGSGLILTAAHVVDGVEHVRVKSSHGGTYPATVLWANAAYDVALLDAQLFMVRVSHLSCRALAVGATLRAIGNPGGLEFITLRGHVSAPPQRYDELASAMILDMTIAPGMSGGPVLDSKGEVVGLVNAMMAVPTSLLSVSLMPIGYAVPGTAICRLLARGTETT